MRETDNAVVRTIALGTLTSGTQTFAWDGRDDGGTVVEAGLYRLVTRLSRGGESWVSDPPVPAGEGNGAGTIPARFNAHRNEMFKLLYANATVGTVDLRIEPPTGEPFYPFKKRLMPAGSQWVYWDGRDPNGNIVVGTIDVYFASPKKMRPHYLTVTASSPAITGTQGAPNIEVKADPYLVTHSYEQLSRLAFRVSTDSLVTVKLLPPGVVDPASSQAIVLMAGESLSAKDAQGQSKVHVVEWRGHEPDDPNRIRTLAEGPYTFTIQATSHVTQRSTLYRGVLQLFQ